MSSVVGVEILCFYGKGKFWTIFSRRHFTLFCSRFSHFTSSCSLPKIHFNVITSCTKMDSVLKIAQNASEKNVCP